MSLKNSYTTSDYLQWDSATNLVRKLYRDKNYRISLLVGCGIFLVSVLVTYYNLLGQCFWIRMQSLPLLKRKQANVGKWELIRSSKAYQRLLYSFGYSELEWVLFLSGKGKNKVYSIQWINIVLKELKSKYNLKIDHFSTHSLRKTFGRKVFESSENAELALVKLMELFNHSSVTITKRYLGLRQEELLNTYDCLSF